jgi:ElaB/YqjD/DUF883 family membrane-anchored ribosome-binding protein
MNDAHKVKNHVERKVNQETGMFEDVKERLTDFAENVTDKLKETGSDMWDGVQERGQDTWKDVKTFVRKNPGQSIGIAFVAGVVACALLTRDRS